MVIASRQLLQRRELVHMRGCLIPPSLTHDQAERAYLDRGTTDSIE
jgi:hypothetical protein